jgi:hypothetical protein
MLLLQSLSWSSIKRFFHISLLFIAFIPGSAFAQNIKYTDGNVDQSMRGGMNVDPSTLGMSFNVTLGNYPGRGVSMPVTMTFDSKL